MQTKTKEGHVVTSIYYGKRLSGLLQMRPPLSGQGYPHHRRQGERNPRSVRRVRRMRQGVPGAREEDPQRPGAAQGASRVRRRGLCVGGAEFHRLFPRRDDRPARLGADARRFRRRERDRPRRRVRKRPRRAASGGDRFAACNLQRLPRGGRYDPQVPARFRRLDLAAPFAGPGALPTHQRENFLFGESRLFRPLRRQEERSRRASRRTGACGGVSGAGAAARRKGDRHRRRSSPCPGRGGGRTLLFRRRRHERHPARRRRQSALSRRLGARQSPPALRRRRSRFARRPRRRQKDFS